MSSEDLDFDENAKAIKDIKQHKVPSKCLALMGPYGDTSKCLALMGTYGDTSRHMGIHQRTKWIIIPALMKFTFPQ